MNHVNPKFRLSPNYTTPHDYLHQYTPENLTIHRNIYSCEIINPRNIIGKFFRSIPLSHPYITLHTRSLPNSLRTHTAPRHRCKSKRLESSSFAARRPIYREDAREQNVVAYIKGTRVVLYKVIWRGWSLLPRRLRARSLNGTRAAWAVITSSLLFFLCAPGS